MKITNDDYNYTETIEVYFFICPKCDYDSVISNDKYCCNCGKNLKWDINLGELDED